MQYEGDMRPISGPTGSLDSTAIADIQKHLKVSPKGELAGHGCRTFGRGSYPNYFFRISKKE